MNVQHSSACNCRACWLRVHKQADEEAVLCCHKDDVERLQQRVAEMEAALRCLLPGLVLDLRYADDDDDKDAMRARIETVTSAINKALK